ncbi:PH domain-containing protein [Candidatus Berkelbacteria bacterium]|nr:PH domain-containing protein [Candidatus Berkelbacteria bacterium]
MKHLHPQPTLRHEETIIEEFGVSPAYTHTLMVSGALLVVLGLIGVALGLPLLGAYFVQAAGVSPLVMTIIFFGLIVAGTYLFVNGWYLRVSRHYYLTNQRVIAIRGLWAAQITSIEYRNITDLQIRVDILTRWLFGIGAVAVNTAGGHSEQLLLSRIDRPDRCQAEIRRLSSATARHGSAISGVRAGELLIGETAPKARSSQSEPSHSQPARPEPRSRTEIRSSRSRGSRSVRRAQREMELEQPGDE